MHGNKVAIQSNMYNQIPWHILPLGHWYLHILRKWSQFHVCWCLGSVYHRASEDMMLILYIHEIESNHSPPWHKATACAIKMERRRIEIKWINSTKRFSIYWDRIPMFSIIYEVLSFFKLLIALAFYLGKHEVVFAFLLDNPSSWNSSPLGDSDPLTYTIYTKVMEDLAMQGARTSSTII